VCCVRYYWLYVEENLNEHQLIFAMVICHLNRTIFIPVLNMYRLLRVLLKHSTTYVNTRPTRCNYTQFILSVNCSTCFGWSLHPSSGAQRTVSTAAGTGQLLLLPVGIVGELRLQSHLLHDSNNSWLVTNTVDADICASDDGVERPHETCRAVER